MEEHLQFERNQRGPFGMGPWQAANAPEEEGHAAARKADRTGMNRAALWMSIGGLFVPYVSVLVHVAAIVMAVVGLRAAKAGHADSRGAAIAALAISAIGLAAYVPLTMILLRA